MITSSRKMRLFVTASLVAMMLPTAYGLLTYSVTVPGSVKIVNPGSIPLIAVYQDPALTQNLTTVSWPTTQAYNGVLVSQQTAYVKNIYSAPVNVTITVTGLPSGVTFTPVTIIVGPSLVYSTQINLTLTYGVVAGNYTPSVVFNASKN